MYTAPRALFSMLDGYEPTNLLGAGDPNVHYVDGRWRMFLGGFQPSFRNNLFQAQLQPGDALDEGARWQFDRAISRPRRAAALTAQPGRAEWDHHGLHEPCFVIGPGNQRRIYYTGRGSRKVTGDQGAFAIGVLTYSGGRWHRHLQPVITGGAQLPNVLGPKVLYTHGKWRMWFRAAVSEPAKGELPVHEIHYTEGDDGVSNWSEPTVFFDRERSFAHAFVRRSHRGYEMLLSTSPNLYGEPGFPDQGLWISHARSPSGDPDEWTPPSPIFDAENGEPWHHNGVFGASLCEPDNTSGPNDRLVYFTGVHERTTWPAQAMRRLKSLRRPPVPAPYYFTIGCIRLTLP